MGVINAKSSCIIKNISGCNTLGSSLLHPTDDDDDDDDDDGGFGGGEVSEDDSSKSLTKSLWDRGPDIYPNSQPLCFFCVKVKLYL